MQIESPQKDKEIEKAIIMLVECAKKRHRDSKPVILHSIRVGLELSKLNQSKEVIIAGILHDLIEDTDREIGFIKKAFGQKVADLVSALTQEKIKDYKKRWHVLIDKIKKAGREAMLIKVVDANDNLTYLPLTKNHKAFNEALWKQQLVRDSFRPFLGKFKVFKEFEKNIKRQLQN